MPIPAPRPPGVEVIVLPSDGEGGTNPLDLNQLLRRFDVRGE